MKKILLTLFLVLVCYSTAFADMTSAQQALNQTQTKKASLEQRIMTDYGNWGFLIFVYGYTNNLVAAADRLNNASVDKSEGDGDFSQAQTAFGAGQYDLCETYCFLANTNYNDGSLQCLFAEILMQSP